MINPFDEELQIKKPTECDKCGGTLSYNGLGEYKCDACGNTMFDDYGKVRDYVEHHAGARVQKISDETGVSVKIIKKMLMEERFNLVSNRHI